ncbi:MAG: sensor domain-containing diguanylate cyclase [Lachnospiraceae bacterium]|nr:sensor domain-containing diguanylate cyclase [Lachnospiraceae bacterium]
MKIFIARLSFALAVIFFILLHVGSSADVKAAMAQAAAGAPVGGLLIDYVTKHHLRIMAVTIFLCILIVLYVMERSRMQLRVQKEMARKSAQEESKYRVAMEISNDILFEYDIEKDLMVNSPRFTDVYGRNSKIENFRESGSEIRYIHREDLSVFRDFIDDLVSGKEMIEHEFRALGANGEFVWSHLRGKTIFDEKGEPSKVIGKLVNIDLQKKELEKLTYMAQMDPFTGVYNKEVFSEIADTCLNETRKDSNLYAFAIIDIDNFKKFNDTYGHLFGDRILKEIVNIAKTVFAQKGDIIGRVGGDEFAVLMKVSGKEEADMRVSTFMEQVRNSRVIDDKEVSITVSMGVSITSEKTDYEEVFEMADSVLYDVKKQGKNDYAFAG